MSFPQYSWLSGCMRGIHAKSYTVDLYGAVRIGHGTAGLLVYAQLVKSYTAELVFGQYKFATVLLVWWCVCTCSRPLDIRAAFR